MSACVCDWTTGLLNCPKKKPLTPFPKTFAVLPAWVPTPMIGPSHSPQHHHGPA